MKTRKLHDSNISIIPTKLKYFFNICYFVMFILKMKMTLFSNVNIQQNYVCVCCLQCIIHNLKSLQECLLEYAHHNSYNLKKNHKYKIFS
jgi:hypothetical protein